MGFGSEDFNGLSKPNASIPKKKKKKKKKGEKIVVGSRIGITNTANDQGNRITTSRSGEYKIPRKPERAVPPPPANNPNDRTGKNNANHKKSRLKARTTVVARLQKDADPKAIRAALNSKMPEKLKGALGAASLELNDKREFVIRKEAGTYANWDYVRKILQKNGLPGWLEWLQGRRGWVINCEKSPYLDYHRILHEAYSVKMRALLKEADADHKKSLVVLYFKQDPLTQENGGAPLNGTRQNTQTLWKKVSEKESLQDAVGKIRPFLEVLRYFCTDPNDKWTSLPWLMPTITVLECRKRLDRISNLVSTLMRSSNGGPDVPVHWAAHPALNHYPRSLVTPAIMTELIVGVANILSYLFLPYPITVSNLDGVGKLLPKFSSWSGAAQGGEKPSSSRSFKKTTAMRSANHYHLPPPPSSNPVEPVIIDLTGLSIAD